MNSSGRALLPIMVMLAPLAHAQTDASLEALEQRIAQLEQNQYQNGENWSDRVTVNGFITFGATRHDVHQDDNSGNPVAYIDRTTDHVDYRELSRAGVQFNAKISDKTDAVVQLLARGRDNFDAEVQWAYISHQFTPAVTGRAGRMVLPFFMHTQYNNVGYAYNWAALPGEAYDVVPFDTMEGVDLTWNLTTGPLSHRVNVYMGETEVPSYSLPVPVVYHVRDMGGVNLTSQWHDWTSWLSYSQANVSLDLSGLAGVLPLPPEAFAPPISLDETKTTIASVGLQYDNGSAVFMAERTELDIDGWFPTKWGGYASAGYRFGKWLPMVTWGAANSHGVSEAVEIGGLAPTFAYSNMVRSKSWTFGVRYDVSAGVDVKLEAQRFYDMSNDKISTNGLFTPGAASIEDDDPTVYRLTIDAAF